MSRHEFPTPTVTVGQLRELLTQFDDNTQVVIGTNDWYKNITVINAPCEAEEYACLTLECGEDFNTHQL